MMMNPQKLQKVNPPINKENDFTLMAIKDLEMHCTKMNDEYAIVDMEGELMSALDEIDRLRIEKRKQK